MFLFSGNYLLVMIAALAIGGIAQLAIKSAQSKWSKVRPASGLTGAQAAERILAANQIAAVPGQRTGRGAVGLTGIAGKLTDHYDPRTGMIALSETVANVSSVTAVAVAAHEVGHAIQDAHGYVFGKVRTALVPVANFGSRAAFIFIIAGLFFGLAPGSLGYYAFWAGVIFYALGLLFQLVTLPVEIDASRRAMGELRRLDLLGGGELAGGRSVLTAAASTYVAAALVSALYLAYYIFLGGRRS